MLRNADKEKEQKYQISKQTDIIYQMCREILKILEIAKSELPA